MGPPLGSEQGDQPLGGRRQVAVAAIRHVEASPHRGFRQPDLPEHRARVVPVDVPARREREQLRLVDERGHHQDQVGLDLHDGPGQPPALEDVLDPLPRAHRRRGQHPAVGEQVLQAHLPFPEDRMAGARDHHRLVLEDRVPDQVLGRPDGRGEDEVDLAGLQVRAENIVLGDDGANGHAGRLRKEDATKRRNEEARESRQHADAHLAGDAGADLRDLAHGVVGRHAQAPGAAGEGLARRREPDATPHPLEERRAEGGLEAAHAARQGRLRAVELQRGIPEVSGFRDGLEVAQVAQVQLICHSYRFQEKTK